MGQEIGPRTRCPNCEKLGNDTSNNNLITYDDGQYCYACGYAKTTKDTKSLSSLIAGTIEAISERKLTLKTCEHYNVRIKNYIGKLGNCVFNDEPIIIFPIYKSGKVVKQKIRCGQDKSKITQRGQTSSCALFGMNTFSPTKKLPIIVTEGEYDAMSVYQVTGLPAVSITRGAKGAAKELLENMEWLTCWREILLCFDMDEPGRKAVEECVVLFEPGTIRSVTLPLKDANEMLLANREEELKRCLSLAETIKPATILFPGEIKQQILTPPKFGSPWPWPFMTKVTYGNRFGEVYMFAGDTSIGKTQFVYEIVSQCINNDGKVGLIDLERQPEQTMQRIIGAIQNNRIYIPNCSEWDAEKIEAEVDRLHNKIALYRPESGKLTTESILINIRYLTKAHGIKFFVLDNLTALSSNITNGLKEHEFASKTTGQLVQISRELNITIFIINHLTKSSVQLNADITLGEDFVYNTNKEGLTYESGRMPQINEIYGGGKVAKLPDYILVCARNRVSSDDVERRTMYIKFLKTRFESSYEGHIFKLLFDPITGKLNEVY